MIDSRFITTPSTQTLAPAHVGERQKEEEDAYGDVD
jgi:hypothetical protein